LVQEANALRGGWLSAVKIMKLEQVSNQVAAIIVVVFQCQMALGVIEERGEFRKCYWV
jgi:hypothetical protein